MKPRSISLRPLFSLPLVLVACTPETPPPQPPSVPIATASAEATEKAPPPTRRDAIAVAATARPQAIAIDGDLADWGDRKAGATIALDAQGLILAADGVADGFWLGLASSAPALPGIGSGWTNGVPDDIDCDKSGELRGGRWSQHLGPATVASQKACTALLEAHARFVSDHERRFVRRFRVDSTGVRELGDGGALTPVTGARAAWKGHMVEVSLPLTALPRMSEAPLTWIGAWAHGGDALPSMEVEKVKIALPQPVAFEPYAELRARALAKNDYQQKGGLQYPSGGQSYQPGVPERLEYIDYDGPSQLARHDGPLYEKKATLGDVEVGAVHAFVESMAIFKKGQLVTVVPPRPDSDAWGGQNACSGERNRWGGVVVRDGAIHALASYDGQSVTLSCGVGGGSPGGWGALVIGPDGSFREAKYDHEKALLCDDKPCSCWPGEAGGDDALTKLTWKGKCSLQNGGADLGEVERTLRWDDKKRRYVLTATKRPSKSK